MSRRSHSKTVLGFFMYARSVSNQYFLNHNFQRNIVLCVDHTAQREFVSFCGARRKSSSLLWCVVGVVGNIFIKLSIFSGSAGVDEREMVESFKNFFSLRSNMNPSHLVVARMKFFILPAQRRRATIEMVRQSTISILRRIRFRMWLWLCSTSLSHLCDYLKREGRYTKKEKEEKKKLGKAQALGRAMEKKRKTRFFCVWIEFLTLWQTPKRALTFCTNIVEKDEKWNFTAWKLLFPS